MKIKVKTHKENKEIEIDGDSSLDQLKEKLAASFGASKGQLTLVFAGKLLKNASDTLAAVGVKDGQTLTMVIKAGPKAQNAQKKQGAGGSGAKPQGPKSTVTVTIKSPGKTEDLELRPSATIKELRHRASELFAVPEENIILIYGGRLLKDLDSLEACGITDGKAINLVTKSEKSKETSTSSSGSSTARKRPSHFGSEGLADLSKMMSLGSDARAPRGRGTQASAPGQGKDMSNFMQAMSNKMGGMSGPSSGIGQLQELAKQLGAGQGGGTKDAKPNRQESQKVGMESLMQVLAGLDGGGDSGDSGDDDHADEDGKSNEGELDIVKSLMKEVATAEHKSEKSGMSKEQMDLMKDMLAGILRSHDEVIDPEENANRRTQWAVARIIEGLDQLSALEAKVPGVLEGIGLPEISKFAPALAHISRESENPQPFFKLPSKRQERQGNHLTEDYVAQLRQLQDMGFTNNKVNIQALVRTKGAVEPAVDIVLQLQAALNKKEKGEIPDDEEEMEDTQLD